MAERNHPSYALHRCGSGLILFFLCVGLHTALALYLEFWQNVEKAKWMAPDSQTYMEVANWLLGKAPFSEVFWAIAFRPVGYPLVLGLSELISPKAIVLIQILLWALAQWMLFSILMDRTGSFWLALVLTALSATCLTPALLPFLALSETLAVFLLVSGLYFAHRYDACAKMMDLFLMLLSMAVGILVRPAGLYLFLAVSGVVLICHWRRPKHLAAALLSLLPLLIQLSLMHHHFGILRVSVIDSVTMDHYLLSRVDSFIYHVPLPVAREVRRQAAFNPILQARQPSLVAQYDQYAYTQLVEYLTNAPEAVLAAYGASLEENLRAGSPFVEAFGKHRTLTALSSSQNLALSVVGMVLALLSVFYAAGRIFWRRSFHPLGAAWFELLVGATVAYYLLISGMSYWQGDRLSVSAYQATLILVGIWGHRGASRLNPVSHGKPC